MSARVLPLDPVYDRLYRYDRWCKLYRVQKRRGDAYLKLLTEFERWVAAMGGPRWDTAGDPYRPCVRAGYDALAEVQWCLLAAGKLRYPREDPDKAADLLARAKEGLREAKVTCAKARDCGCWA